MKRARRRRGVVGRVSNWLRQKLFAGLLALFPLAATIWVARRVLGWVDSIVGKYLDRHYPEYGEVPGVGIVALFLLLLITGTLVRSYIGRKFFDVYDGLLTRVPFARTIYVAVKQLIETMSPAEEGGSFRGVGLIEYPRRGTYAVVFVTQEGVGDIESKVGGRSLMSVFLPTTPNPTSGYLLLVPKEEVITLDMSVEDATKFIISAGIVTPTLGTTPPPLLGGDDSGAYPVIAGADSGDFPKVSAEEAAELAKRNSASTPREVHEEEEQGEKVAR